MFSQSLAKPNFIRKGPSVKQRLLFTPTPPFLVKIRLNPQFLRGFVFKSITTFLPTYFVEIKGLSLAGGGLNTSIFFLTGVVVQPIGGILADR